MRWRSFALGVWLALSCATQPALGHGSVHGRLDASSRRLAAAPLDAGLYAERAKLYGLDDDWERAARDLERARALDPELPELEHHLANALLRSGAAAQALPLLDALLEREPDHADAYLVRGRARVALAQYEEGADDFGLALVLSVEPAPGLFLERAWALARAGREAAAVEALEVGMARLGPLVSLIELGVDLEARAGRFGAARGWLERLPAVVRESPAWRLRKAHLLLDEGRPEESDDEARAAIAAIDALPEARRRSEATKVVAAEAERLVAASRGARREAPGARRLVPGAAVLGAATVALASAWFAARRGRFLAAHLVVLRRRIRRTPPARVWGRRRRAPRPRAG